MNPCLCSGSSQAELFGEPCRRCASDPDTDSDEDSETQDPYNDGHNDGECGQGNPLDQATDLPADMRVWTSDDVGKWLTEHDINPLLGEKLNGADLTRFKQIGFGEIAEELDCPMDIAYCIKAAVDDHIADSNTPVESSSSSAIIIVDDDDDSTSSGSGWHSGLATLPKIEESSAKRAKLDSGIQAIALLAEAALGLPREDVQNVLASLLEDSKKRKSMD